MTSTMRTIHAVHIARRSAWVGLVVALVLDAPMALTQSVSSSPTLKGGVQQNAPAADVFNGGDSGPTSTNQPGVGGSPACRQVDPECGGTNRQCYNEAYHSTAIVMSIQQSNALYQQTRGQIWIRCGTCRTNLICWPRPGFENLIAGRAGGDNASSGQSGGPGASQSGNETSAPRTPGTLPLDDTMRNVVASCARILQQQGSLDSRPSCRAGSVLEWCRLKQMEIPGCVAIVADNSGPGSDGNVIHFPVQNVSPPPAINQQSSPNGTWPSPTSMNSSQSHTPRPTPLQGNIEEKKVLPPSKVSPTGVPQGGPVPPIPTGGVALRIGATHEGGYYDPIQHYYVGTSTKEFRYDPDGHVLGGAQYQIDLNDPKYGVVNGVLANVRRLPGANGSPDRVGMIEPTFENGFLRSMSLFPGQYNKKHQFVPMDEIKLTPSTKPLIYTGY